MVVLLVAAEARGLPGEAAGPGGQGQCPRCYRSATNIDLTSLVFLAYGLFVHVYRISFGGCSGTLGPAFWSL